MFIRKIPDEINDKFETWGGVKDEGYVPNSPIFINDFKDEFPVWLSDGKNCHVIKVFGRTIILKK